MTQEKNSAEGENYSLALLRGLDILMCFSERTPELTISDLSTRLGINGGTVHRLVITLEHKQYLTRHGKRGGYSLGLRGLEVAKVILNVLPVRLEAVPIMHSLTSRTSANTSLGMLAYGDVVYVERMSSPLVDDPYYHIGRRAPAYCTSMGKALLAHSPADVIDAVLADPLTPLTPNTTTDPEKLRDELEVIRNEGFAKDDSEYMPGSYCIAAPIFDGEGTAVAAMSLSTTRTFLDRDGLWEHLSLLLQSCSNVSHRLGYGVFDPRARGAASTQAN